MDVVSPDLVWLEGRCYRINDFQKANRNEDFGNYENQATTPAESDDDIEDYDYVQCNDGRIKLSLNVALFYFGYIIGAKGSTLKRLMNETKTDIKMPPRGRKGDIIIRGPDKKNVAAAVRRINMIVSAARKKQRPTHFLSIQTTSEEILANYNIFKEKILKDPPQGVEESIFIPPAKLHITLMVMCLMDNEERTSVTKLLQDAKTEIIDPIFKNNSFDVDITGISYMNDDPKSTHVLYGEVMEKDENHRGIINEVAEKLKNFFSNNGFEFGNQAGKMHVTLMNSKKRINDAEGEELNENKKRIPFDASMILETYSKFHFGRVKVDNIHLSQMSTNSAETEYYPSTATISIA